MTIIKRLEAYCVRNNLTGGDFAYMAALIKEAQRDQRHACAEAVNAVEGKSHVFGNRICIPKDETFQAVFNADARKVERARAAGDSDAAPAQPERS
jgi:hypothetical protein